MGQIVRPAFGLVSLLFSLFGLSSEILENFLIFSMPVEGMIDMLHEEFSFPAELKKLWFFFRFRKAEDSPPHKVRAIDIHYY